MGKKPIHSIHSPDFFFYNYFFFTGGKNQLKKKRKQFMCGSTCNIFSFEADENKEKPSQGFI